MIDIYQEAFESLPLSDRDAMLKYQAAVLELKHSITADSSLGVEKIIKNIPGAGQALRKYDQVVGKLMRNSVNSIT